MRIDRTAAQADRLDAFWDRLNDSELAPASSAREPPEVHLETLVLYLESLKPVLSAARRAAMGATVGQSIGKEPMMASSTAFHRTPAESNGVRRSPEPGPGSFRSSMFSTGSPPSCSSSW